VDAFCLLGRALAAAALLSAAESRRLGELLDSLEARAGKSAQARREGKAA
jgi:hypothetical protein